MCLYPSQTWYPACCHRLVARSYQQHKTPSTPSTSPCTPPSAHCQHSSQNRPEPNHIRLIPFHILKHTSGEPQIVATGYSVISTKKYSKHVVKYNLIFNFWVFLNNNNGVVRKSVLEGECDPGNCPGGRSAVGDRLPSCICKKGSKYWWSEM